MLAFATAFHDADLAQRIVLGPGLLLLVVAISVAGRSTARWVQPSLSLAVALVRRANHPQRRALSGAAARGLGLRRE